MNLSADEKSICSTCGANLGETSSGDLGCMACLLRVGLDGETSTPAESRDRFGTYVIERHEDGTLYELGRGAMGVTYCALDTSLKRNVALKIIAQEQGARNAESRERFMRGARAAAALRHENVATVYHFGIQEETGQCFYAMELIEGETLEERVRRSGPLSVRSTIAIARQVSEALAAAEKHGLVHRDLKPSNLMLVESDLGPKVKVIDFGLAKALSAQIDPMSLTQGGFVGTPAFASPEQFNRTAIDVRSDIYSLGVTLWFALTGKTPFVGRSVEEICAAQRLGALPIEQLQGARVPSRLISLLASMLALEPAARPGTGELTLRLARCRSQANGLSKGVRFAIAAGIILIACVGGFFVSRQLHSIPSDSNARAENRGINAATTSNPKAHEAYLKGRFFWGKRTDEGHRQAIPYFEKAIGLDPNYAQAYSGLADAYLFLGNNDPDLRKDHFAKAKAANRHALELDPTLAAAHTSLGLIAMNYDWDWAMAEREFRRAIELDPNYATAHHWYAEFLIAQERFDESLREINLARDLDPLSLVINTDVGKMFFYARRYDEAEAQFKETLKMEPNFLPAHMWLASVYTIKEQYEEAIAEMNKVERLGSPITALEGLAITYAYAGRRNEVEQTLVELKRHLGSKPLDNWVMTCVHIGLGEKDKAFACLEREYETRAVTMPGLRVNSSFDPLREDPRFADLLRRVGLAR